MPRNYRAPGGRNSRRSGSGQLPRRRITATACEKSDSAAGWLATHRLAARRPLVARSLRLVLSFRLLLAAVWRRRSIASRECRWCATLFGALVVPVVGRRQAAGAAGEGDGLFGLEPTQHLEHLGGHRWVECRGDLVAGKQSRLHHQGPRDRHALPVAAGELGRPTENVLRLFAGMGRRTEGFRYERDTESSNHHRNTFPMGYRANNLGWIESGIAGPCPTCDEVMSSAQR